MSDIDFAELDDDAGGGWAVSLFIIFAVALLVGLLYGVGLH